jgi:hypothetical protein
MQSSKSIRPGSHERCESAATAHAMQTTRRLIRRTETRIREAARHFALTQAIFLIDDDVMNTEEDNSFDFDKEFDSTKSERQGQLRDILAILPDDVKPKIKQRWVQDSVRN